MDEQQYINGFNRGYLIAKHEPELASQLAKSSNNSPFFNGMIDGKEQYEHEVREWAKGFSRGGHDHQERDNERDR